MLDSERRAWLRLARTENVGPVTFRNLVARFGSASAALEEVPRLAARGGSRNFLLPDEGDIARELDALAKQGGRMIAACETDYPQGLKALEAPAARHQRAGSSPSFSEGDDRHCGARMPAPWRANSPTRCRASWALPGWWWCPGLARGIDASAHEAALAVGTVAVVAGGVDIIYPPKMTGSMPRSKPGRRLVRDAVGRSAPSPSLPRRNRIISGLARGVVVVEAAEKSGSLITGAICSGQGREVFAVPGSPLDPRAKGANRLIREGAP
jgi:DNA processing protein